MLPEYPERLVLRVQPTEFPHPAPETYRHARGGSKFLRLESTLEKFRTETSGLTPVNQTGHTAALSSQDMLQGFRTETCYTFSPKYAVQEFQYGTSAMKSVQRVSELPWFGMARPAGKASPHFRLWSSLGS